MDKVDAKRGSLPSSEDIKGLPRFSEGSNEVVTGVDFKADCYKMNHSNRGIAVIFNNKTFHPSTGMGQRNGSDVDASAMYDIFSLLGFEKILLKTDLRAHEIKAVLQKVAAEDHSSNDCFACVILTHGVKDYIYGSDRQIAVDELVAPFKGDKCKSLAGKPKIFFIQACRGTTLDEGVTVADGTVDSESEQVENRSIPTEADFLLAFSSVPGYYAWRNSSKGSWFIQAISSVLRENWCKLDLLTMMTRVNKIIAFDFESSAGTIEMSGKKQIPCITSMLTKDVFFKKY